MFIRAIEDKGHTVIYFTPEGERYMVEDLGWLTPIATVKGILSGEIDGVVAEKAGRTYVRTRPDSFWSNNLDNKGRK